MTKHNLIHNMGWRSVEWNRNRKILVQNPLEPSLSESAKDFYAIEDREIRDGGLNEEGPCPKIKNLLRIALSYLHCSVLYVK